MPLFSLTPHGLGSDWYWCNYWICYPNYRNYIDKSTGKYEVDSLLHKGHYDGHVEHLLKWNGILLIILTCKYKMYTIDIFARSICLGHLHRLWSYINLKSLNRKYNWLVMRSNYMKQSCLTYMELTIHDIFLFLFSVIVPNMYALLNFNL